MKIPQVVTVALTIVLMLVGIRLGWMYYERWRPLPQRAEQVARLPQELDTLELKILNFYAAERPVRGQPFQLCYGVINAAKVVLEPPLAEVRPVLSRCAEVTLRKETELTLRAYGKNGEEASASFVVGVQEPRPEIVFVNVSSRELKLGANWVLCYGVKNATRVWLEPGPRLELSEKTCTRLAPVALPRKLVAESAGGREEVVLPLKLAR